MFLVILKKHWLENSVFFFQNEKFLIIGVFWNKKCKSNCVQLDAWPARPRGPQRRRRKFWKLHFWKLNFASFPGIFWNDCFQKIISRKTFQSSIHNFIWNVLYQWPSVQCFDVSLLTCVQFSKYSPCFFKKSWERGHLLWHSLHTKIAKNFPRACTQAA